MKKILLVVASLTLFANDAFSATKRLSVADSKKLLGALAAGGVTPTPQGEVLQLNIKNLVCLLRESDSNGPSTCSVVIDGKAQVVSDTPAKNIYRVLVELGVRAQRTRIPGGFLGLTDVNCASASLTKLDFVCHLTGASIGEEDNAPKMLALKIEIHGLAEDNDDPLANSTGKLSYAILNRIGAIVALGHVTKFTRSLNEKSGLEAICVQATDAVFLGEFKKYVFKLAEAQYPVSVTELRTCP